MVDIPSRMDPDLEVPPRSASVSTDPSVRRATTVFAPSGGPFFARGSGEAFPRVTAVQSWENSSTNGASGGGCITTLIDQAEA